MTFEVILQIKKTLCSNNVSIHKYNKYVHIRILPIKYIYQTVIFLLIKGPFYPSMTITSLFLRSDFKPNIFQRKIGSLNKKVTLLDLQLPLRSYFMNKKNVCS